MCVYVLYVVLSHQSAQGGHLLSDVKKLTNIQLDWCTLSALYVYMKKSMIFFISFYEYLNYNVGAIRLKILSV